MIINIKETISHVITMKNKLQKKWEYGGCFNWRSKKKILIEIVLKIIDNIGKCIVKMADWVIRLKIELYL